MFIGSFGSVPSKMYFFGIRIIHSRLQAYKKRKTVNETVYNTDVKKRKTKI